MGESSKANTTQQLNKYSVNPARYFFDKVVNSFQFIFLAQIYLLLLDFVLLGLFCWPFFSN